SDQVRDRREACAWLQRRNDRSGAAGQAADSFRAPGRRQGRLAANAGRAAIRHFGQGGANMIPTGGTIADAATAEVRQPSRTYKLEFARGRVAGMTDGLDAIKQAVYKILQTDRFRYEIYSFDYGHEL